MTTVLAGDGGGFTDLLRLASTSAGAPDVVYTLPAYLALEPAAGDSVPRLVSVTAALALVGGGGGGG